MKAEMTERGLRVWFDSVDDPADLDDLAEELRAEGWEQLYPEEIAALTDAPIFGEDVERDDVYGVTALGRVIWYPDYMISDPIDEARTPGGVLFTLA